MILPDAEKLLFGPYRAPKLRVGDRAFCLARRCEVVVTSWTDGPIPWPRGRAFGTHGGGSGLLVDEVLARAIRSESSLAVQRWWGAAAVTVARWRKLLGVGQWGTIGSRRLHQALSEAGNEASRRREVSAAERAARSARARAGRHIEEALGSDYNRERAWKPEELALLGTMSDLEVARRTGRTRDAVKVKRRKMGIPNRFDGRRAHGPPGG